MSFTRAMVKYAPTIPLPKSLRWRLLRALGVDVVSAGIESGVRIRNAHVRIGRGAFLNHGVTIEGAGSVVIGTRVALGPDTLILTSSHEIGSPQWRAGDGVPTFAPVTIGDGTWIGARSTILPGASIGSGCVIAAGSVVTGDCPPNTLWAGVPAVQKRTLEATPTPTPTMLGAAVA